MHVFLCYLDVVIVYNIFQQEYIVLSLFAESFNVIIAL